MIKHTINETYLLSSNVSFTEYPPFLKPLKRGRENREEQIFETSTEILCSIVSLLTPRCNNRPTSLNKTRVFGRVQKKKRKRKKKRNIDKAQTKQRCLRGNEYISFNLLSAAFRTKHGRVIRSSGKSPGVVPRAGTNRGFPGRQHSTWRCQAGKHRCVCTWERMRRSAVAVGGLKSFIRIFSRWGIVSGAALSYDRIARLITTSVCCQESLDYENRLADDTCTLNFR